MVNHKEILRLKNLGLAHQEIAASCGCGRNTVTRTLARAREQNLSWDMAKGMSPQQVTAALFPSEKATPVYKMPDYEWVHREMQKSGVTLSLLWVEYCEQCRQNGELPYKSTQFNKYYTDYEVFYVGKIQEYDFSWLGLSSENLITLITCVRNQPELRWCVQAREIS